jgi:DNA-binding NarL/FixJ family response regulator
MVKMQEEREVPRRFSDAVDPPQSITALNLPARDRAGVGPPIEYENADRPTIRVVLADSENLFRAGIQTIFALEDDIRVIAQADTLAGLHHTIQRFPTDVILLVEGKLIASTVDAIPELVRRWPKLKIIVSAEKNDETNTVELYFQGVQGIITRSISPDLLVKCVRRIAAGETWIDNQSINYVIEAYRSQATALTSFDPALFPRGRSFFREGYAVHSCIAAGVEEQAPRIGVVIFPALCDDPVVTGQLQHLCIGIFPTNAPAVMCSFKVRDGSKARPMPCGMLFFVPMALQSFKSRVDHSISPP